MGPFPVPRDVQSLRFRLHLAQVTILCSLSIIIIITASWLYQHLGNPCFLSERRHGYSSHSLGTRKLINTLHSFYLLRHHGGYKNFHVPE